MSTSQATPFVEAQESAPVAPTAQSSPAKPVKVAAYKAKTSTKSTAITETKPANPVPASASASVAVNPGASVSIPGNSRSIKHLPLYVHSASEWAGRPAAIYDYQVGSWYGDWNSNVQAEVNGLVTLASAANQLPLLVAYNIPGRDCGSYSSGGAGSSAAYRSWLQGFANGIGNRKAIVVLEPDALAQLDCLNTADQNTRLADLVFAVTTLKNTTQASVYIDGGNAGWKATADMADRLKRAGIVNASGFSLNVANFKTTEDSVAYGESIVSLLKQQGIADARYVIDTGRNGRGPAPASALSWCNPSGRGLGKRPTTSVAAGAHADAYLWIKTPGESDGSCERGEPAAGQWFPSYAQMLIDNAVY